MNEIEDLYKTITNQVFPKGNRDIEIKALELLLIIDNKTDLETAKKILLKSLMISILSDDFTEKRLIRHLNPYAIQFFTESELKEFYNYILLLKSSISSVKNDKINVRETSSEENKKESIGIFKDIQPLMFILFVLFMIYVVANLGFISQEKKTKIIDPYWETVSTLSLPKTGTFWKAYAKPINAPFKVMTTDDADYIIKLINHIDGEDYIKVFIRGGDKIDILVPLGKYDLKYATGNEWYGIDAPDNKYFGPETSFHKADEIFEFYETSDGYMGNTVELFLQRDGNLRTSTLNSEDF